MKTLEEIFNNLKYLLIVNVVKFELKLNFIKELIEAQKEEVVKVKDFEPITIDNFLSIGLLKSIWKRQQKA